MTNLRIYTPAGATRNALFIQTSPPPNLYGHLSDALVTNVYVDGNVVQTLSSMHACRDAASQA